MLVKSFLGKKLARYVVSQTQKWSQSPIKTQEKVFWHLVKTAKNTAFGKDHHFAEIRNYEDFKARVPVRDYEGLKSYIERIQKGEKDVLWKGRPVSFAKTSGTTSGAKYIPLTKASLEHQISAAKNALLHYIEDTGNYHFVNGKMIFLQGSPELNTDSIIPVGRLSGIVANYVPSYLQSNRLPSYETNCIEDWEQKVEAIIDETLPQDMRLISGIPSWVQMYFERLHQRTGKNISEVFPNFSLFVFGGVNYEPYRKKFEELIGKKVDSLELYPASEGFIAFQDKQEEKGLLLLLDYGIFYEFIPAEEYYDENPTRISLNEVELGVNYVIILNTNAGLWGYNIGDTIQFTCVEPYRIVVSGRIKHFTSAFGEHVIGKEVDEAMRVTLQRFSNVEVTEFTVAPQVEPQEGLPYHEWLVEFANAPEDLAEFSQLLDTHLQSQNVYYKDLIEGKVLRPLVLNPLPKDAFYHFMKSQGKLGGQNKVPRLSNDRKMADELLNL
ncbi:GH3 auxin-responsive promoter family protein [Flavobacteriales bacterium]|nr:GH3 auxin-responsive promoter family protein [Flavobacteriales bacterium]